MDTLTHGLLGVALAALPLPSRLEPAGSVPVRASVLVSVLAAELPDLDYLLPAEDEVLHTLSAHRGYSHSLIAAPVVALVAALLAKTVFRGAALKALYWRALLVVPLGHLLPDLWTGWGTRLLLPFSERRLTLDWTMVLDPLVTLPLLIAAVWALARRQQFRRAMAIGASVAALYVAARVGLSAHLTSKVSAAYPGAHSVHVFPSLLGVAKWRYCARLGDEYAAGYVSLGAAPVEAARHQAWPSGPLATELREVATVSEALSWARFPVVRTQTLSAGTRRVTVADLRYHLGGKPTLTFVIDVEQSGRVKQARLDRGGDPAELLRRARGAPAL
jgi:inner membrane protein